jgi:SET domain-containing protein
MTALFEGKECSIPELEKKLQFTFLPQIAFESPQEKELIREKGLQQTVSPEAKQLGAQYISQIEASYISPVSVRFVNEAVGYGLFAAESIPMGAYVGEYTGIVRQNDRTYFEPLNNYCYEYPVPDSIGRSYVTDATQGHLTRFINHSFTPNLKPIHVFHDGYFHLIFLSLVPIEKGTQLTFNYGRNYWNLREPPAIL